MELKERLSYIEQLEKRVIQQAETIESLKCCGNCGIYKANKDRRTYMTCTNKCARAYNKGDTDLWQPIN